jgi:hypothetical protein
MTADEKAGIEVFDRLIDDILEGFWRNSPSFATYCGIHKFDREMDHVDRATRDSFLSLQKE